MRVHIDVDRCCSSGNCVLTAPEVFDQSETDGTVRLLHPEPPREEYEAVRRAVSFCPGGALRVGP